jgi:hypothetical protein
MVVIWFVCSVPDREATVVLPWSNVAVGSMLSKKSQTALQLISRRKTKHATIARRYGLRPIAEVAGEFIAL